MFDSIVLFHETAEPLDGVVELPNTQLLQQTDENETWAELASGSQQNLKMNHRRHLKFCDLIRPGSGFFKSYAKCGLLAKSHKIKLCLFASCCASKHPLS